MKNKSIITFVIVVVILLGLGAYFYQEYEPSEDKTWGITFSQKHAAYYGYDWRTVYLDMLNDLKPTKLRLMTYWDQIEAERGKYNFTETAEMLVEAEKRNIDVILVVGHKQPRWPECHHPSWYGSLSAEEKDDSLMEFVKNSVNYYKQFSAVKVWQVENEALFAFGYECPKPNSEFLKKEMDLVRSLDGRPVLLTDSGELGLWVPSAKLKPDIFGSTMYRVVHNPKFGYFKYPFPPGFFKIKAGIAEKLTGMNDIIGVELQAEPWFTDTDVFNTELQTQYSLMNPKIFDEYVDYARSVGFKENYLWGVEWWYWLAKEHNDWGMWESARSTLSE